MATAVFSAAPRTGIRRNVNWNSGMLKCQKSFFLFCWLSSRIIRWRKLIVLIFRMPIIAHLRLRSVTNKPINRLPGKTPIRNQFQFSSRVRLRSKIQARHRIGIRSNDCIPHKIWLLNKIALRHKKQLHHNQRRQPPTLAKLRIQFWLQAAMDNQLRRIQSVMELAPISAFWIRRSRVWPRPRRIVYRPDRGTVYLTVPPSGQSSLRRILCRPPTRRGCTPKITMTNPPGQLKRAWIRVPCQPR